MALFIIILVVGALIWLMLFKTKGEKKTAITPIVTPSSTPISPPEPPRPPEPPAAPQQPPQSPTL